MSLMFNNAEIPYMTWNGNPTSGIFNEQLVWGASRIEKCLYSSTGTNDYPITLSEPLSGYDEVMFKMNWKNTQNYSNGQQWQTCKIWNNYDLNYYMSNSIACYLIEVIVSCPSGGTTLTLTSAAGLYTNWTATRFFRNTPESRIINEIWGVKYV